MNRTLLLSAPSRLHLGLLSFRSETGRSFGGAGIMIDRPSLELQFSPAVEFSVQGPGELKTRITQFAQRWASESMFDEPGVLPGCSIKVLKAPRSHAGLGSGTQLALSVGAGLNAFCGHEMLAAPQLAQLMGRGERSAVGSYGFELGGFLVEAGRLPWDEFPVLVQRIELPEPWRFVLVIPRCDQGLHGLQESDAFGKLPDIPEKVTAQLAQELLLNLMPAALQGDVQMFGQGLYRYGVTAGNCFAQFQYGSFASELVAKIVKSLRTLGCEGVAQSSWGPTVFGVTENQAAAEVLVDELRAYLPEANQCDILISSANSQGATISALELA